MDHEYWIALAEGDWQTVQNELDAQVKVWPSVAFHCHATVEKYLKAFLAFKGVKADRTHDLNLLLSSAIGFDPTLSDLREVCESLNDLAIDSRYPDVPGKYDEEFGRDAYSNARGIREIMRNKF